MKDSGVEWLGEIPAHWDVKRVKLLSSVRRGASPRPIDDPIYFDDEGEYAWVRIADVTASDRYLTKTTQRLSDTGKARSVPLEPGELFLSIAGSVGKPIITQIKCCIHDGFVYFERLSEDREFLYYIFSGGELYKGLGKLGTQLNLNTETVGNISIPLPPLHEQRAIAAYLDRETARIDSLIGETEALNVLLREKRVALISRAVTKGLDAGAEMKESGVEWLGEIPKGWEVKPLYTVTSAADKRDPSQEPDTHFRYIDVSSISSEQHQITAFEELMGYDAPTRARNVVFEGDTIFATVRPYLRNIALIPIELHDSICSTGYCVLRAERIKLESRYLFYSCISAGFVASVVAHQQGVSYPAVSDRVVRRQVFPLPPLHEQRVIASYLDRETAKIDALIAKNDELIALLREKRSALISAAVTGKIAIPHVDDDKSLPHFGGGI